MYAACCAIAGFTAGTCWVYATGTFHPPIWGIAVSSILIGLVCDPIASTITRALDRPKTTRRRAHARPAASRPRGGSANPTDTTGVV